METISAIFVILGLLSAIVIAFDLRCHKQSMGIMNAVWILTGLWGGILALVAYFTFGRAKKSMKMPMDMPMDMSMGGKTNRPNRPKWQAVTTSTLHCGAGCTLADMVGEGAIYIFAIAIGGSFFVSSIIIDYILALAIGVYFQYAAMASMSKLPKSRILTNAFKADFLSLTAWQIGMYGFMAIAIFGIFGAHELGRNSWTFWFMMQIAMMVGFIFALPVNAMLIKKGIKKARS